VGISRIKNEVARYAAGAVAVGRDFEPLITIIVGLFASVLGFLGIQLGSANLELSQEALRQSRLQSLIERAPSLGTVINAKDKTISVKNNGLGPAQLYQSDLLMGGKVFTIRTGQSLEDQERIMIEAVRKNLSSVHPGLEATRFEYQVPNVIVQKDEEIILIKFIDDAFTSEEFTAFKNTFTYRFCYQDLLGQFRATASSLPPEVVLAQCPRQAPHLAIN
jgi:hypothetical protein